MIYRLIILTGDRRGEQITVTEEPMTIGSGATCDVRIIDPEMAQTHAEITHQPGGPTIHDLGSMNRILVNHREVRQSVIKHGDLVELGRTRLLVQAYVQAEVEAGEEGERRRKWRPVVIGVAVLLLILLIPLTCRWRPAVPPPPVPVSVPTPPPRIKVVPGAPQASRVVPPVPAPPTASNAPVQSVVPASNSVPRPVAEITQGSPTGQVAARIVSGSNAVTSTTTADVATAAARYPAHDEGAERAAQEVELAQAATAVAESKARALLVQVKDHLDEGDLDEAERILTEVFWFRPDFPPALEQRARLLERRGRLGDARRQWESLAALTNAETVALAKAEISRIDAAREAAKPPAPAKRLRIDSVELSKFPETAAFHEMRLLTVRLIPTAEVMPDTGEVKVEVVFYERDAVTGAVAPAPDRGPREAVAVDGAWHEGEAKVVSASYTIPASASTNRSTAFYGYVVRVLHHAVLQDATAQPRDLLPKPVPDAPAAPPREPAGRPGAD